MQARGVWSGVLVSGDSVVIPLFLDSKLLGHAGRLKGVKEQDLEKYTDVRSISLENRSNAALSFGVFAFLGDGLEEMIGMVTKTGTNLQGFFATEEVKAVLDLSAVRKYLTIVNSTPNEVPLVVRSSVPFALATTVIGVQAHYGGTEV